MDAGEADGEGAPAEEEGCEPARGADVALHDPVGGHFEEGVGEGEEGDGDGVVHVVHACSLEKGVTCFLVQDFGVSDITAVEVVEQVDPCTEGEDVQVHFSDETAGTFGIIEVGAAGLEARLFLVLLCSVNENRADCGGMEHTGETSLAFSVSVTSGFSSGFSILS